MEGSKHDNKSVRQSLVWRTIVREAPLLEMMFANKMQVAVFISKMSQYNAKSLVVSIFEVGLRMVL